MTSTTQINVTASNSEGVVRRARSDRGAKQVKWLVDVIDETGETVALATILTMVKKPDQS